MRQRVRKTILVISFLLFPITIWYFSPYLIIQAASEHILNGSFIVFVTMLILSMFFFFFFETRMAKQDKVCDLDNMDNCNNRNIRPGEK